MYFIVLCLSMLYFHSFKEHIQKQLVQKNTYIGVIHAMKVHGADPAVQEAGCRALRGLSIFR